MSEGTSFQAGNLPHWSDKSLRYHCESGILFLNEGSLEIEHEGSLEGHG